MISPEFAHTRPPSPCTAPEGYIQDDTFPSLWWGSEITAPSFSVEASWSLQDGHQVLISARDALTPIQVGALIQALTKFQRTAWAHS